MILRFGLLVGQNKYCDLHLGCLSNIVNEEMLLLVTEYFHSVVLVLLLK